MKNEDSDAQSVRLEHLLQSLPGCMASSYVSLLGLSFPICGIGVVTVLVCQDCHEQPQTGSLQQKEYTVIVLEGRSSTLVHCAEIRVLAGPHSRWSTWRNLFASCSFWCCQLSFAVAPLLLSLRRVYIPLPSSECVISLFLFYNCTCN